MTSLTKLIELEQTKIKYEFELEIQQLKEQLDYGQIGDLAWLKERTSIKSLEKLKESILYPFRSELEGKIVFYADGKGIPWRFNKHLMNKWLVENFERIEF